MKQKKRVLTVALALMMVVQTVINGNFAAIVKAAKSETAVAEAAESGDHKVTIFYGYGVTPASAENNKATSVFIKETDNIAYSSTAKYGLTNGDFSDPTGNLQTARYGQTNVAQVTGMEVIYGDLTYRYSAYSTKVLYLSSDKTKLNIEEGGTKLLNLGGNWTAKSQNYIRFHNIADDLTIVYHYVDEVALSINAGDGASYTSNFPGYSTTDDSNVFVGYSRPREISNGFDTSIHAPEGKAIDYINLQIGEKALTIPNASVKNGTYINSSYELTNDSNNALLYYKGDKLTVYTIKENISVDVSYMDVKSEKTITVIGAEGSKQAIASSDFLTYVTENGGDVDFNNGVIRLNNAYSGSKGLGLTVNAAYGTVSELVITMGEHTWTLSGNAITASYTSFVGSDYKEVVRSRYAAGDLFKYAYTAGNNFYSFRFYEIREDITIAVHYKDCEAEVVDEYGSLKVVHYDQYPEMSNASVTDNTLKISSRYLRGSNSYSYRVAIRAWNDEIVSGFRIRDEKGVDSLTFLKEDKDKTDTTESLGKIKFAYSGGVYYIRVLEQTADKLIITPIVDEEKIHVVTVTGSNGTQPALTSPEFLRHVSTKGGKVSEEGGKIALLADYSSGTGLRLDIAAAYGSVDSITFQMGGYTWTVSKDELLSTTVLYADSAGKGTVKSSHSDGDMLRYEHSAFSSNYSIRLYDVHDDVTVTVVYRELLGDLNTDGMVAGTDVVELRKLLVESRGISDTDIADYNRNGQVDVKDIVRMKKYLTELHYSTEFDDSLFYQNTAAYKGADPAIIYVDEGKYAGTFFMYITSSALGAKGFQVYSSKNLTDWVLEGTAFAPGLEDWADGQCWAPEVIYDDGLYYMFYSARWGEEEYVFYISAAVSDSPVGPFKELATSTKSAKEPLLIFENHRDEIPAQYRSSLTGYLGKSGYIKVIDASPFIDSVSGKKYLYFVADIGTSYTAASFVFGMEMEDWGTPKYETLTKLTSYGYTTVDKTETAVEGENTNEGPFMYYHDGNYYLTFSTNTYYTVNYQVHQAIGTSPLGPFEKVAKNDGGAVIWTDTTSLAQGCGHHAFVEVGDELWISYHTLANDENIDDGRTVAVDKVVFVENKAGQRVLKANGTTRTMQPLPAKISGYEDMAVHAKVSCWEAANDIGLLKDGSISLHREASDEFRTTSGSTEITFDFEEAVTLRSILVYNSSSDAYLFDKIEKITVYTEEGVFTITDLLYDMDARTNTEHSAKRTLYDLAAVASFDEIRAWKVVFTFDCSHAIGIPEIRLMGKSSANCNKNYYIID